MRDGTLEYAAVRPPRRVFAWEHALGAGAVTAMVLIVAFVLAPAAEATLRGQGVRLPGHVVVVLDACGLIRRVGWMLAWAPAVTVGLVAGALGSRGRRKWLVLRVWLLLGVVVGLAMGLAVYGTVLQMAMDAAGGK